MVSHAAETEGGGLGDGGRVATAVARKRAPAVASAGCASGWHLFNGTERAGAMPGGKKEREVCFKVIHATMTHREASAECR